jgi:hypothetical protein
MALRMVGFTIGSKREADLYEAAFGGGGLVGDSGFSIIGSP